MELTKVAIRVVLAVMETCLVHSTLIICHIGNTRHWKKKKNRVLTDPEGKKGGLCPFKNLKLEQLRGEL